MARPWERPKARAKARARARARASNGLMRVKEGRPNVMFERKLREKNCCPRWDSNPGCTITKVDDIGAVEDELPSDMPNEYSDAEVAAVSSFSRGLTCLSCNGNIDHYNDRIGCCTKCSLKIRLDKCRYNLSVKLL